MASGRPDTVAPGYDPAPIWQGLGMVDFAIVPHFASDHAESEAAARAAAWMTGEGITHRTLRDVEAVVRRGDDVDEVEVVESGH